MKRDALAFVYITTTLLVALREWFRISRQAGGFIHRAAARSVGLFSMIVPLALIALSIELFRARNGEQALPHHVAGGIKLVVSLSGLAHVTQGDPSFEGIETIEPAGGVVG